jgi:hypothetical protein
MPEKNEKLILKGIVLQEVYIIPNDIVLAPGDSTFFSAEGVDTDGDSMSVEGTWTAAGGTIDSTGIFIAGDEMGTFNVTFDEPVFGLTGTTSIIISDVDPGELAPIIPVAEEMQAPGVEFWVDINVGSAVNPVSNLFGVSFQLDFTHTEYLDVVAPFAVNVIPGGFLGDDVVFIQTVDDAAGTVDIGLTRKLGQMGVNGSGTAARVKFVSDAGTPEGTQIVFSLSDITANDSDGNDMILSPLDHDVTITAATLIDEKNLDIPTSFELSQNFPNPFNPSTMIRYAIPSINSHQHVSLEVFNTLGKKGRTLVNQIQTAGAYSISWDGADDTGYLVSGGIYVYRLKAGSFVETRKMLYIK